MSSSGVVIFVEGDTELEFYKRVVDHLSNNQRTEVKILFRTVKGVGNYQRKVPRIFEKDILPNNPTLTFHVILCYDTDVFEFASKPPVNWRKVEADLNKLGAKTVGHVKARKSIEDYFLEDYPGVLKYLKLPKNTPIPAGKNGIDKMKILFKRANKPYVKGAHLKELIEHLDIDKIVRARQSDFVPLIKVLNLKQPS